MQIFWYPCIKASLCVCPHAVVDCGPLLAPAFAAVLLPGGTVFSSTAEYICDVGFALEGNQFRFCMESGEWNGTEPVCEGIIY